jgi:hypothetical protein
MTDRMALIDRLGDLRGLRERAYAARSKKGRASGHEEILESRVTHVVFPPEWLVGSIRNS